ncbi:MAG TPA: competence protein ComEA [Propionibacteriaceae bacterium]|nr:competence protein ComEA [Propionibacteriaceae bacterium]
MPDVTEQTGELSAVARRRLNELLSQPSPAASSPLEVDAVESAQEPSPDWITSLREAGASVGAPSPVSPADEAPTRGGGLPRWFGTAVTFTREHLVTVVVVLVVGILWTGYSLFQVRTAPVADAVPRVANTAASPNAPATGQPSVAVASSEVVVHVIGAVRHAGVYQLAEGSRVADAIAAAGGLSGSADTGELNLAQVLSDGLQLKIGTRKHPGGWLRTGADAASSGAAGADPASAKLSINSATEAQLDTLPGIGPVTAAKIVAWRTEHGKFTALTELQEVDGIGPKTYADLADRVQL